MIVSTNIAETSVTLENISFVVDCGFSKKKIFNPRMRIDSLLSSPISKVLKLKIRLLLIKDLGELVELKLALVSVCTQNISLMKSYLISLIQK